MSAEQTPYDAQPGIEPRRTRKDLFKAAGVVAGAAVAAKLATAESASAADGQPLIVGGPNSATSFKTALTTGGPLQAPAGDAALEITALNFDNAISGKAKDYGVVGTGAGGVLGLGTVGGVFSGQVAAVNLDPQTLSGAPTGQAFKGDLAVDHDGVLWLCVLDGTPGTFIKVSHGGVRPLPSPVRVYSSTEVTGGARMNRGEVRNVQIAGPVAGAGVPSNAIGVVMNLTLHQTINAGFVTAFPTGTGVPATSSINWFETNMQIANGATIGLGTNGQVSFYCDGAASPGAPLTQIIVDITGYIL